MRLARALVTATALMVLALTVPSSAQPARGRFVEREIIVKFRPGTDANAKADAHRSARGAQNGEIQRTNVQRVRVDAGDEDAAIARYRGHPNVEYAERNYIRRLPVPLEQGSLQIVPGDFYFQEQWALHNTGQSFYCIPWIFGGTYCQYIGTADADIDAPEAWAITAGNSGVTVAVIDSGIDYTHPDLAPNYAGGDDFVFHDGDPMDDHGHGTHVAGTIAAALENLTGNPAEAEGVTGVAPHARILAYKVCRSDGTCDDFAIQQAIARAVTDGAKVINMSLGESDYSQSLNDAVQDVWNAGVVIVAGAGNDGTTAPFYPAAFAHVVSVAAFDEDHLRPSFSNYGNWVDISAPGNAIMSTYPMSQCATSTTPGDIGCYAWNTGTSMATPHVAGAAALVWSRSDVTSNVQVVDILLKSADPTGVSTVRLDSWTIHGGLNLHDAIRYGLTNLPPHAHAGPDQTVADSDRDGTAMITLDGNGSSDSDGTITSYEWREGGTSIGTGASSEVSLAVGVHTLTLEVTDDDGDTGTDTVVITVTPANQVTATASTPQAAEAGTKPGVFTVARTGDTSLPLDVHYTVGGTAVAGTDYVALSGAVTIQSGASSATVVVTPVDDGAYEPDETVTLAVSTDAAYGLGSQTSGTVTIVSDDAPPDLTVSAMSAPTIGAADTDIVVTDTTKNQGAGASLASKTGFYLSANTTLDGTDVWIGERSVSSIGPGITAQASTTLHVPPSTTAGSYRILAKADWDNTVNENSESNNVRASGAINIGPDLTVSALTATAAAAAGGTISVADTTKNQGGAPAGPSTTRFYWSTNTTLDASDLVIGSRSAGPLAAGVLGAGTTTLTVPTTTATGSYYVIAQADGPGEVAETSETNNTRASGLINVGPDLTVSALTAPATAAAGGTISVSDTTKNQGAAAAGPSTTRFFWSANTTLDASDELIGSRLAGPLAAGAAGIATATVSVPASAGTGSYYVIAQADGPGDVPETSETNNTRASAAIKVGADLVVTALAVPASAAAGGTITANDTTKNQGAGPAPGSSTGFYLSTNSTFSTDDKFIGSRSVGELAANGTSAGQALLQIPAEALPGSYYVVARADWNGTVGETTETNNDRSDGFIRIGGDLVLTALSASAQVMASGPITITDTTTNQGSAPVGASTTAFYLSINSTYDAADQFVGNRTVGALVASSSSTVQTTCAVPVGTAVGRYYVIAVADVNGAVAESLENNNTRTGGVVYIGPDLTVTTLTRPTTAVAGTTISVTVTTKNQGADTAPVSVTRFYLSSNSSLDAGDQLLGALQVSSLGAGLSEAGTALLPIPAATTGATYYIIASADGDDVIPESQETNNTYGRTISIAAAPTSP